MTAAQGFVVALVTVVMVTAWGAAGIGGLVVWAVVRQLDRLVNGWAPRDDDGDDDGDGYGSPPPPDVPPALAVDVPRGPGYWAPPGPHAPMDPVAGDEPRRPVAVSPAARRAALAMGVGLSRMTGVSDVGELAEFADPLPGHDPRCVCPTCLNRLIDRYAAAGVEQALVEFLPGQEGQR